MSPVILTVHDFTVFGLDPLGTSSLGAVLLALPLGCGVSMVSMPIDLQYMLDFLVLFPLHESLDHVCECLRFGFLSQLSDKNKKDYGPRPVPLKLVLPRPRSHYIR